MTVTAEEVTRLQKRAKRKTSGQLSFMSLVEENTCNLTGLGIEGEEAELSEYGDDEKCRMEKEAFGFFLIGHPLQPFRQEIRRLGWRSHRPPARPASACLRSRTRPIPAATRLY